MPVARVDRKTFRLKTAAAGTISAGVGRVWQVCVWGAVWMAAGAVSWAAIGAGGPAVARYSYEEATGTEVIPIEYAIERGEQVVIRVQRGAEEYYNRCDVSGATVEWHFRGKSAEVRARRVDNTLVIEGLREGKAFRQSSAIDGAPWLQPLSYALRPFATSGRQSLQFWFIRPDNFDPVKMKATRAGSEEITVGQQRYQCTKIDVSPAGLLSIVWRGSYWFRKSDTLFLRYSGGDLLSGPADTVIHIRPESGP